MGLDIYTCNNDNLQLYKSRTEGDSHKYKYVICRVDNMGRLEDQICMMHT